MYSKVTLKPFSRAQQDLQLTEAAVSSDTSEQGLLWNPESQLKM